MYYQRQNHEMMISLRQEYIQEFADYLYDRENAPGTIRKYQTDVRTFYDFLKKDLKVTKRRLVEYKEWLQDVYALSSANSMLAALNQFLDFLGASRLKVRRIKIQNPPFSQGENMLSEKEYSQLINTAEKLGKKQLALILETIGSTGIRVSELQYFTVENVKRGCVEVRNKGKHRMILIPSPLRSKLLDYSKKQGINSGVLFRTRTGRAKNRSNVWKEMKCLAKNAGVNPQKVFPHNFRHFFASSFYQMTKNLVHLADILGHSSLEVTRGYARSSLADCMKDLDGLYSIHQKNITEQHNNNYVVKINDNNNLSPFWHF